MKRLLVGFLLLVPVLLCTCTDTNIYHQSREPNIPNKVAISGTVCTDDPAQRQFPVRVMFIVDTSGSMADSDPELQRQYAVEDIINRYVASPNYTFAIIKFAGEPMQLTDGYTKNLAVLNEAVAQLGSVDPCVTGGGCRDWQSALSLANSVFTGDVLTTNPGTRSRTRYVFIYVANGPPHSPLPTVQGCDEKCRLVGMVDEMVTFGLDNGAAEVAFHAVQLDWCTGTCDMGTPDIRYCNSTTPCPADCAGTEVCETPQKLCSDDHSVGCSDGDGFCQGQSLGNCSPEWLCTGDHVTGCDGDSICQDAGAGRCEFLRVCNTDPSVECVRNEECCPTFACLYPSFCDPAFDDYTAELLSAMSFKGQGEYVRFTLGPQLNFWTLDFDTTQSVFVKKAFIITNVNVKALNGEIMEDSDGDGMSDEEEECYGEILAGECRDIARCNCTLDVWDNDTNPLGTDTNPILVDTDGDMLNDMLETRFATVNLDPLRMDLPQACYGLEFPYKDRDADTLNDCEEKLIGTDHTLFDTDRDGYPDQVEFRAGTNYLQPDHLKDTDMDGLANGIELEIHLDPQSNDINARSGEAYRYKVVDEGLRVVPYTSQPHLLSGVEITDVSGRSAAGSGTLFYYPAGSGRPYPTMAWRDPSHGLPGMEVEIAQSGVYVLYSSCSCVKECPGSCPSGEFCDPNYGQCVTDPCVLINCASTEKCDPSSGRCFADCTLSDCDMGQRCDPLLGKCLTDRCLNISCPAGKSCDPEAGVCARSPCEGWSSCPGGTRVNRDEKPPWITVEVSWDLLPQAGFWCDGSPDNDPCQSDSDCPQNSVCRIRENIVVGLAHKNCISFKVKNITLVQTLAVDEDFGPGYNNIYAYFAQTPLDNPYAYSIFRAALRQIRYYNGEKDPDWAEIPLGDGDFFAIEEK